jgi:pantoate--beta-alanine ligase
MKVIQSVKEMQSEALKLCREGKKVVLVPTMGALHEAHLKLLEEGKKAGDILVLSIFVNPTQFGPAEDFDRYPKEIESDLQKARDLEVDITFIPNTKDIYPESYQTYVNVEEITKNLCGLSRPGHFTGVATVVLKLFNIVQPEIAIFGEKDYQQLQVIRRMATDLNVPTEIRSIPTVGEENGLAMSSRNKYLTPEERTAALSINQSLSLAQKRVDSGEKNAEKIILEIKEKIEKTGLLKIDYVSICDPETLEDIETLKKPALLAIAVKTASARLIDNAILRPKQ